MDPTPIPKRFWWLKRLGILAAVLAVLIGGLRWYWGQLAQSRLDNALAKIRARGEPTRLEQLKQPGVPDKQNAAHYLRQALNHWPRVNGKLITETDWWNKPDDPVVGAGKNAKHPDPIQDQKAYLKRCEKSLKLLQKAENAPKTDWGVKLKGPGAYLNMKLNYLSKIQSLTRVLADMSKRAHKAGNDRLAVRAVQHQLSIASRLYVQPITMIQHLVAISSRSLATDRIESLISEIAIDGQAPKTARPAQLRRLIGELADVSKRRNEAARAMKGERVMVHDTAMGVIEGHVSPGRVFYGINTNGLPFWLVKLLAGPHLRMDARLLLKGHTTAVLSAEKTGTMPEWRRFSRKHGPDISVLDKQAPLYPISRAAFPALDAAFETSFISQAEQQMAAVALAIRLYETDHGRRSKSLSQLVPEYLDRVPGDPLASQRRPIQYRPNGVKPFSDRQWSRHGNAAGTQPARMNVPAVPLLYSVGKDNQDDGGKFVVDSHGNVEDKDALDRVFLLEPAPEAPEPPKAFKGPPWRRQGGRRGPPATQSAPTQPATTRPAAEAEAGTQPATQPAGDGP